jgi:hypothetical protein
MPIAFVLYQSARTGYTALVYSLESADRGSG